jgi:hypothetical protein
VGGRRSISGRGKFDARRNAPTAIIGRGRFQRPRADRRTAGSFVVVHVDALQLQVGVTAVGTGGVDTVLIADNLWREGGGWTVNHRTECGREKGPIGHSRDAELWGINRQATGPQQHRVRTSQNLAPIWLPH